MFSLNVRHLTRAAALVLGLGGAASAYAAGTCTLASGSLPKDLKVGKFTVVVDCLVDTPANGRAALDPPDAEPQFDARFQVYLYSINSSTFLPSWSQQAAAATSLLPFYISAATPLKQGEPQADNLSFLYEYQIEISEATPGAMASSQMSSGTVTLKVDFYLGGSTGTGAVLAAEGPTLVVNQQYYAINDAPAFDPTAAVAGSMELLTVKWVPVTTVATKGTDPATPKNVPVGSLHVYVIDPGANLVLPAKKTSYTKGSSDEPNHQCTITLISPPPDGEVLKPATCVKCDDVDDYIDEDALGAAAGVRVVNANDSDGSATITGLTNGTGYTVFMTYAPAAIQQSLCMLGIPTANYSLTEINGEGNAEKVDFRCFIATAAYGSPMDADLHYFRKFRSNILLNTALGRGFVHYYYKFSPPLAQFIADHPRVKAATRAALRGPAWILKKLDRYY